MLQSILPLSHYASPKRSVFAQTFLNLLLVGCVLVFSLHIADISHPISSRHIALKEANTAKRYDRYVEGLYSDSTYNPVPISSFSELYPEKVEAFKKWESMGKRRNSPDALILSKQCLSLSDMERILDPDCYAWWMYELQTGRIVDVRTMLGFGWGKQCALQVVFESGLKGWYKPCGGYNGEFPEAERVASLIDFFGGFQRAAPAVMRNESLSTFQAILQRQTGIPFAYDHLQYLLDTEQACAIEGSHFSGVMIGWWNNVVWGDSLPKRYEDKKGRIQQAQKAAVALPPKELSEQLHSHAMFYILGILRSPGKNEHIIFREGQDYPTFLLIDLDRMKLGHFNSSVISICNLCKLGRVTYDRLKEMSDDRFARLIQSALYVGDSPLYLSGKDSKKISVKARDLVQCIDECIDAHGEENVLLEQVL